MNMKASFNLVFTNKASILNILMLSLFLTVSDYISNIINSLHQITMIKKSIYLQFIHYPFDPILLNVMDNIIKFPALILFLTFCVYSVNEQLNNPLKEKINNGNTSILTFLKFFPQGVFISIIYLLYFLISQVLILYFPFGIKLFFILLIILFAPLLLILYLENLRPTHTLNIKKIFSKILPKTHLYIYALLLISILVIIQQIISVIEWRTIYHTLTHGFITNYIGLSIFALLFSVYTQIYYTNEEKCEKRGNKSYKKKLTIAIFAIIIPLIIISVPMLAFWYLSWAPGLFWDGPFYGTKRAKCPATKPAQTLKIWDGMTLKVYDKTKNDIAPTIQVLDTNNQQQLCMYTTETYKEPKKNKIPSNKSSVRQIRFLNNYNSIIFYEKPRIKGSVDWSGGPEGAIWIFNRNGKLEEYYFSW